METPLDVICRSMYTSGLNEETLQCVAVVHLYKYIKLIAALARRAKRQLWFVPAGAANEQMTQRRPHSQNEQITQPLREWAELAHTHGFPRAVDELPRCVQADPTFPILQRNPRLNLAVRQ